MRCPVCDGRSFARDHASARAYGFLFFGAAMLFVSRGLLPLLEPLYVLPQYAVATVAGKSLDVDVSLLAALHATISHAFSIGLISMFFGAVDLYRDNSRYCLGCGFRGRFMPRGLQTGVFADDAQVTSLSPRREKEEKDYAIDPMQPVPPLLKMLHFKSDAMRRQAAETLRRVTGQSFADDAAAWEGWYAEHGAAFEQERRATRKNQA